MKNNYFACKSYQNLQIEKKEKTLRVDIPSIDAYFKNRQLEIVSHACLHVEEGASDPRMALKDLVETL